MEHLNQLADGYKAFDNKDEASVKVLFGSETGTAARVARDFADGKFICVKVRLPNVSSRIQLTLLFHCPALF